MIGSPNLLKRSAIIVAAVFAVAACGTQQSSNSTTAANVPGVTSNSVLFGATFPLSGTASFYYSVAKGASAYFAYVNDTKGGVNGRKITLKVLDDGYDPSKTPALTRQLIEQEQIFAAYGNLGTATNTASRPIYNDNKVPDLFVFTGASKWGTEYKQYPWTIGWQPDYISEGKVYAKDILANHPSAKIGILYQNDAYGKDYVNGIKEGLGSKASSLIIAETTYEANATDVKSQVAELKNKGADTFYDVCTPTYCVQSLVTAASLGWKPLIYLNNVGSSQVVLGGVIKALGGSTAGTEGVITIEYLKDPNDTATYGSDATIALYKSILSKYCQPQPCDPTDNFYYSGMASAFTLVDVLGKAGKNLTRDGIMNQARNINEPNNPFLIPGIKAQTSGANQFPLTQMQLAKYTGNHFVLQGGIIDAR